MNIKEYMIFLGIVIVICVVWNIYKTRQDKKKDDGTE